MKSRPKSKRKAGSLKRRVNRRRENRALDALIALALHPLSSKQPTDAEIDKFLSECKQGKHKLNAETKAALDRAGHDFLLKLKEHMGKTGNTIYGKPVNEKGQP